MKRLIYTLSVPLLAFCIFLTGCLKDKDFDDGTIQSVHNSGADIKPIELKLTATDTTRLLVFAVDNSDKDTVVNLVPVNLATREPAPEDIHVTVAVDNALIDARNASHGTDYTVPSSSMYSIENAEVVIPKGSHTGYLQIKFKPSDFLGGNWAIGFKITAVKESGYTISGNFDYGIVSLIIKNEYDGIYNAVGHFDHPSLGGDYSTQWVCATSGATSITFQLDATVLFAVNITLTVNPDNSVDVSTNDVALDPYDPAKNYYDPDTRTFHLDFSYSGGTRHLVGTATYAGPR